jgi:O-antigen ligase
MQLWASKALTFAAAGRLSQDFIPALIAFAAAAGLSQAEGGYFPRSWGVAALALLWVVAVTLVFRPAVDLRWIDLALLGGVGGLVAWTALSSAWSASRPQTVLEVERTLVYVAAVAAVLLTARRRSVPAVTAGVLAGIVIVSTYGLATRLLPDVFGPREARHFDAAALFEPLGYSNAVGSVAALGAMLALGFAARAASPLARAAGAAAVVLLVATLYLSLSRGAWLGLGAGLISAVALDRRRLQLLAVLMGLAPFAFATVMVAWRSPALIKPNAPISEVTTQGHRLAAALVLLGLAAATAAIGLHVAERRLSLGRQTRRALIALLAVATAAVLVIVFVRAGSPPALAARAYTEFTSPPNPGRTAQEQLLNVSSGRRTVYWSVAWQAVEDHPAVGFGAGTFGQYWQQHRQSGLNVLDAHNLYLETLAELGPIGLALLLVALGTPLVAAWRARDHPFVPPLLGAYVVYVVQASLDWLWEMAAVTVVAFLCGTALALAARNEDRVHHLRLRSRLTAVAAVTAAGVFSFVALIGNSAVDAAERALAAGEIGTAQAEARKATRWAPWASEPWRLLGEAQLAEGRAFAARTSFTEAVSRDERNWILWYDLGFASEGAARRDAFARAYVLNPLDVRRLGAAPE